jgi:hypothetical protein
MRYGFADDFGIARFFFAYFIFAAYRRAAISRSENTYSFAISLYRLFL